MLQDACRMESISAARGCGCKSQVDDHGGKTECQTARPSPLERLRQYDTATICNIIELFDVRLHNAGHADGRIVAAFPELAPMVGFAATATFRPSALSRSGDAYASLDSKWSRLRNYRGRRSSSFKILIHPPRAQRSEKSCAARTGRLAQSAW